MQQQRWKKIELIVDQALSLNTVREQKNFIEEKCKDDHQLLMEVRLLLNAIHEANQNNYLDK